MVIWSVVIALMLGLTLAACGSQPPVIVDPTVPPTSTSVAPPGTSPTAIPSLISPTDTLKPGPIVQTRATATPRTPAPSNPTPAPSRPTAKPPPDTVPTVHVTSGPGPTAVFALPALALSPAEISGLVHPGVKGAMEDLYGSGREDTGPFQVLRAEQVTWPDASRGCPEPGMAYAQVLTSGIWLVLSSQGNEFDYRITGEHWTRCQARQQGEPLARQPLDGLWSRLAPVPTPRSEVAVAELDGKLYVVGGFGRGATANEEYDPAANTWRRRAPIPRGVDHAAAVSVGGRIYLIGGFDGRWGPVADVWSYHPKADAWTRMADLPTPRGALGAVVVAGKIYAIGGVAGAGDVGTTEVYDPASDTWAARSDMPTPRDHLAVAVAGGKIHVIGGRLGSFAVNLDANEVYDPSNDTWTERAALPTARSGIAAVAAHGRVYVFGGESLEGTFDTTERYDPATNAWDTMPPLPTARHGLGAVVLRGRIYVLAGGTTPGGSSSGLNEAFILLTTDGRR